MRSMSWSELAVCCGALLASPCAFAQGALVAEGFDDANLAARGWYDRVEVQISTREHAPGSQASAEFHFAQGATEPTAGAGMRIRFPETERVYLSFWIQHSVGWTGSNQPWHPHQLYLLTNLDGAYAGPASTHLTVYVEENEGEPVMAIQDASNIDATRVGTDLTEATEDRAVAGCNGGDEGDDGGRSTCYEHGGSYRNGRFWRAGTPWFGDEPGALLGGGWHHVEVVVALNSLREGRAVADGVLQYWVDGALALAYDDVVMRTGRHPEMRFNQLLIGPYIGDGSPIDQTFWLDELLLATEPPPLAPAGRAVEVSTP